MNKDIIDIEGVVARVEGDREFFLELADAFFVKEADWLEELRTLVKNSRLNEAAGLAHRIKSALLNLGAVAASKTASLIEAQGKGGALGENAEIVDRLAEELKGYREEVEKIRAGKGWGE